MNNLDFKISLITSTIYNNYEIVLFVVFITPILIFFFNSLCFKFNILDFPNKRKKHSYPMPISGGIALTAVILLVILFFKLTNSNNFNFYSDIFFFSLCFFIFGFIDDTRNFYTNTKVLVILSLIILMLLYSKDLIITNLKFYYIFEKNFTLDFFSIPFTIFCIFMLFNALNFADGKNGISISLCIFWLTYMFFKVNSDNFLIALIIISLIIILYFNLKNKIFLGNSGVNFLSIFIGLLIVKSYNTQNIYLFCDEIFLLLFIPGIDAARVTIYRALKNKSPFSPDRTHLHHYLEKILNDKFIWIAYTSLSILPILILSITENFFISILSSIILYILLFNKFITKKFKSIR